MLTRKTDPTDEVSPRTDTRNKAGFYVQRNVVADVHGDDAPETCANVRVAILGENNRLEAVILPDPFARQWAQLKANACGTFAQVTDLRTGRTQIIQPEEENSTRAIPKVFILGIDVI